MKRQFFTASVVALLVICVSPSDVEADIVSMDSSFGQDTLTLDTDTNLLWLDVTLSTQYSYDQITVELMPGGVFDGYRLASTSEVTAFWENAGIQQISAGWLPVNYEPVRDLMEFVGITAPGLGNSGQGWYYDYVAGHTADVLSGDWAVVGLLGAYDDDLIGRAHFGSVPQDNMNPRHGSWLVTPVPAPGALLLGMLGLSVAGVKLRKRA